MLGINLKGKKAFIAGIGDDLGALGDDFAARGSRSLDQAVDRGFPLADPVEVDADRRTR